MTNADEVARLPIAEGRAELLEEIMAEPQSVPHPTHGAWVRWAAPLAAAAAVVLLVAGIALVRNAGRSPEPGVATGSPAVCWDGSAGPTCPQPAGAAALTWVFPRLAGRLDGCVAAAKATADDPPMPYGTPGPGSAGSGSGGGRPAAYRCDLAALGVDAQGRPPAVWVYALGPDGSNSPAWAPYLSGIVRRYHTGTFSIGGEQAGRLVLDEVGLVHPRNLFIAEYADYPFAVMGFADDTGEVEQILAALGARRPSEMTRPGSPDPSLPAFPSQALQPPMETPTS